MAIEIIKNIATVAGCILTLSTLATLFCKPLRNKFIRWIQKTSHTSETEKSISELQLQITELSTIMQQHLENNEKFQADICESIEWLRKETKNMESTDVIVLRDRIIEKSLEYKRRGWISERERESLTDMHNKYVAMGGNSYEHIVYQEAMVLPTHPSDE